MRCFKINKTEIQTGLNETVDVINNTLLSPSETITTKTVSLIPTSLIEIPMELPTNDSFDTFPLGINSSVYLSPYSPYILLVSNSVHLHF